VNKHIYYLIRHNIDSLQVLYYNSQSFSRKNLQNFYPQIIFKAKTAKEISFLLQYHNYVFLNLSSDHALYLGRELMKAEIALAMGQKYIQD
jgi:dihydropteroate synthase